MRRMLVVKGCALYYLLLVQTPFFRIITMTRTLRDAAPIATLVVATGLFIVFHSWAFIT